MSVPRPKRKVPAVLPALVTTVVRKVTSAGFVLGPKRKALVLLEVETELATTVARLAT